MKPGVTPAQVQGNLDGVFRSVARGGMDAYLDGLTPEQRSLSRNRDRTSVPGLQVDSGKRGVYDASPSSSRQAVILGVVVLLVLLIVCANVATLLLSRATTRQKEIAVRQSVGATRGRLVRLLVTESVVLAAVGGGLGVLVALGARQLLPFGQSAPFDWRVFTFVTGLSLTTGRTFAAQDSREAPAVVLINATAARELFGDENPLGRRFGFSPEERHELEIIGVVQDVKYRTVRDAAPPTTYRSAEQSPLADATFMVRTAGQPSALTMAVRDAVQRIDPTLPLIDISTQAAEIEERFSEERLFALAYTSFGGLATLLAAIGLFGLASYNVTQRTNEIGIRMALGAEASSVARMVLGESLVLVAIGLVVGIGGVLLAGRLVASLLFELAPTDPLAIAQAVVVLVSVAAFAGYLPARRAARVDPRGALQDE